MSVDRADIAQQEAELLAMLDEIRAHAPAAWLDSIEELIRVWEFRVALENLCCNLHELEVELPKPLQQRLVELAQRSRVDEKYWADLE